MMLGDRTVEHLLRVSELPDLEGTRYRIVRELGRGGMGIVYEAKDGELEREVALKVLTPAGTSPDAARRMIHEAKTLAALEHPGIVPVHDVGFLPDGRVFYAMKLVRGKRLDEQARETNDLAPLLRTFIRVCEAVAFANARGVVHRDLKPENIMVGAFGEALVMDWGVATNAGGENDGAVAGTKQWMAPEQARGGPVDIRADVYSLGMMLAFLSREERGKPLRAIIARATAPLPEDRYDHANALAEDVQRFLDRLPVSAYRESPLETAGRWISRNRTAVTLVAAYVIMRFIIQFWPR
jgi:serine/threonine protein kinase